MHDQSRSKYLNKKTFAEMGNSSEKESEDEEIENQSLLAIEKTKIYDFLALVALTEPDEGRIIYQSQESIQALITGEEEEEEKE
ncbi:hypothetical protein H5410_036522 [Solanum commersonii]|uniref:Uncharacterized protein n=1 Tax=Solanum commersonii TaxID=4109 RepID=A0A9J5Y5J2_SOLCO|nr:hypothetical protein H5410_036522 [Solanum commersonii]